MPTSHIETETLENFYQLALEALKIDTELNLTEQQLAWLQIVVTNPERRKGVLTVLITSLLKKVIMPTQDVRQHQENLQAGYSGRTLDTSFVTPFLRTKGFPHMAESGWLTRSLEQNHAYDKEYPGKITPPALKEAFLNILDNVQNQPDTAQTYLIYILSKLEHFRQVQASNPIKRLPDETTKQLTVSTIVAYLQRHFTWAYPHGVSGAARLPVLALYATYQCLVQEVGRYKTKELYTLESHTAADSKSCKLGDIEVAYKNNAGDLLAFEAVEVKFGIAITLEIVRVAYEKIRNSTVERYYILSTSDVKQDERRAIDEFIAEVRAEHGCEIIANGVASSLKYYLRLLGNVRAFLENYATTLENDTAIKQEHRQAWNEIIATPSKWLG
jgi:DNA (cytosine-5)-methyltransferase 1